MYTRHLRMCNADNVDILNWPAERLVDSTERRRQNLIDNADGMCVTYTDTASSCDLRLL